jgi:glycosyl transferase family 2
MPKVPGEPVDVVVPVRSAEGSEYRKLLICCRAIRSRIPVNQLIVPSASSRAKTKQRISELADIPVFDEDAVGAGPCRNLGLKKVQTEFYASIDADTAVREEWYPWCIRTIRDPNVAACQGYSRPLSRLLDRFVTMEALDKSTYADLGNTMLRTDVVKALGMPTAPMLEDHMLHNRIIRNNYQWIVNRDISSDHLLNELDVLWHRYWYGRFEPQDLASFWKLSLWIARDTFMVRTRKFGSQLAFFISLADLAKCSGSLIGYYSPVRKL